MRPPETQVCILKSSFTFSPIVKATVEGPAQRQSNNQLTSKHGIHTKLSSSSPLPTRITTAAGDDMDGWAVIFNRRNEREQATI
jgi:hypothetical protein